jgi:hypothetical protein
MPHDCRHYNIWTRETLKGQGIEFREVCTERNYRKGSHKIGMNQYCVTNRAFDILRNQYPISMETFLD